MLQKRLNITLVYSLKHGLKGLSRKYVFPQAYHHKLDMLFFGGMWPELLHMTKLNSLMLIQQAFPTRAGKGHPIMTNIIRLLLL